ncbi:hypothetical protein N7509_012872 [Penicillium cosmopolitanum]|uniref:BTB domain-containing protein n=1 Tax=Penicillium cosmopolitanum TaxID=1131564 RepID=A0A9W9VE28_9EURO|nr:uncharacterized protein N7509_012872 [Penicillium cosmopolitanum]KAJ5375986.1 hypothetical protein N7509_012872 [Penicillium cosmopolitanum]
MPRSSTWRCAYRKPLPVDNDIAFEYICAAIYYQEDMVPEELTTDEVLDIAIMAGKYDFMEALSSKSESWLQAGEKESGEVMILTAAAYILNNANHYRQTYWIQPICQSG